MVGGIGGGAFIRDFAIRLERHETVREADRDEQLVAVFRAQFGADPLAIGGRAVAHVDRDIEDPPPDAAHQLVLPPGRRLEMQAAQGEGGGGIGVVVLDEGHGDAQRSEGRHGMHLGEPATGVAMAFGADELDGKGHGARLSVPAHACNWLGRMEC